MKKRRPVPKGRGHVIVVSPRARALLDREVARIQKETGGRPNAGKIADRIIIEILERKDGAE